MTTSPNAEGTGHPTTPWTAIERKGNACFGPNAIEILIKVGDGNGFAIVSLGGCAATDASPQAVRATAQFILTAVNSHHRDQETIRKLREANAELTKIAQDFVDGCDRGETIGESFFSKLLDRARQSWKL